MAKDPKEYGYEGEMAMSQLKGIMMHAKQLHGMLKPDTDLPEWVQSKITLAYDYIQTAADYMNTEMNEAQLDENLPTDIVRSQSNFQTTKVSGQPTVRTGTSSVSATPVVNGSAQTNQTYGVTDTRNADGTYTITRSGAGWGGTAGTRTYNPAAGTMTMGGKTYQKMPNGFYNKTPIKEDAPTNAAGSGAVAGIGVGAQGEPGVKKKKYQEKNAAEAPSPVMSKSPLKRMFVNYTKGK